MFWISVGHEKWNMKRLERMAKWIVDIWLMICGIYVIWCLIYLRSGSLFFSQCFVILQQTVRVQSHWSARTVGTWIRTYARSVDVLPVCLGRYVTRWHRPFEVCTNPIQYSQNSGARSGVKPKGKGLVQCHPPDKASTDFILIILVPSFVQFCPPFKRFIRHLLRVSIPQAAYPHHSVTSHSVMSHHSCQKNHATQSICGPAKRL